MRLLCFVLILGVAFALDVWLPSLGPSDAYFVGLLVGALIWPLLSGDRGA